MEKHQSSAARVPQSGDQPFKVSCPVEVRFRDCDMMGHVNNAVYLTYLENARFAYWKASGLDRIAGDISYIMARVEIDFRASAELGDTVDVALRVTSIGRSSFWMEYELRNQSGDLIAAAKSVQVSYDWKAKKSVPVPDAIRAHLAAFEGVQL
jgi:acyl-CoA thioester hydrolase